MVAYSKTGRALKAYRRRFRSRQVRLPQKEIHLLERSACGLTASRFSTVLTAQVGAHPETRTPAAVACGKARFTCLQLQAKVDRPHRDRSKRDLHCLAHSLDQE